MAIRWKCLAKSTILSTSKKRSATAFAKEAEAKGFKVRFNDDEFVEDRKAEGKEYPYMVEATREDSPLDIDDIVWDLLELASPFEGDYDGWGCANVQ